MLLSTEQCLTILHASRLNWRERERNFLADSDILMWILRKRAPQFIMFQLRKLVKKYVVQNNLNLHNQQKKKIYTMERCEQLQTISICSQLNLHTEDLNVPELMSNAIYRRLYNIVVNDRNKTEYEYRKNLIRQLYFLLKITPIMKLQLQQSYLEKLQAWYNKNDHKKTQLGSGRLRDLVDEYCGARDSQNVETNQMMQRPQSGVPWNKNVIPFLRPYTAQRPVNSNTRPQSYKSKYGGRSTKASTQLDNESTVFIKDFALSVREQFEMSQDFIAKNRTIHPQQQPIYEQLFSIISKAGILGSKERNMNNGDDENEILFQRDREEFITSQNEDNKGENKIEQRQDDDVEILDLEDFGKVSEESEKDQQQEEKQSERVNQQPEQFQLLQKKAFVRDRAHQGTRDEPTMEGFMHLREEDQYDTTALKKLNNKYSHITNNKFINYSKDDHEMVRHYVEYSRVKSAMRKELSRKSQAQRLLSAKCRSSVTLSANPKGNNRIYSAMPNREKGNVFQRNNQKLNKSFNNEPKVFDFSKPSIKRQNANNKSYTSLTHYNQRKQLDRIYRSPIEDYKKFNKNSISVSEIKSKDKNLLTKYDCFLTRDKVNPIADVHVEEFNKEALDEIERIKEKVAGLGKKHFSTDSLMKALYIDSYDDVSSCQVKNGLVINSLIDPSKDQQQVNDPFDWRKRDIYFNLVSNGQKKLKKKKRQLKKKQK